MTRRAVHQVLVGAGRGDAITSMAVTVRDALRRSGPSEIYAHHLPHDIRDEVLPLTGLGRPKRGDLIVYHASMGEPEVTRWLLSRPERLVVAYHNITPAQHFLEYEPQFASNLFWGRHELTLIRDRVVLAVADSTYNAHDLEAAGYTDVHVVPVGLKPSRLTNVAPAGALAERIRRSFPHGYVLTVSQMLPHKRFETIVQAMHLVQWVHGVPLGLAIVGQPRMEKYQQALQRQAQQLKLDRIWFFGGASEAELATFYRMASMYVVTSAHEGLALPPLEAMSFGIPVIARAAGALEDTIGGAGIVLPPTSGPALLSEAITEVANNSELRLGLQHLGTQRVASIEIQDPAAKFMALLAEVS